MTKSVQTHSWREDSVESTKSTKYDEIFLSSSLPDTEANSKSCESKRCNYKWILIGLCYTNFWAAACISLQAPFFPKEAEAKGATPTQYGFVFGIFELVVVFMSPVYSKMIPRIKPKFLTIAGVIFAGVSCILFGSLDVLPSGKVYITMAYVIRILEGFASAAVFTASFTIIAAQDNVGTSFSMLETAYGFGLIIGPTIGGALYEAGGFPLPFVVCGICLITAGVLLVFALPRFEKVEKELPRDWKAFLFNCDIFMYTTAIITTLLFLGFNDATLEPHLRKFDLQPSVLGLIFIIPGGTYAFTTPLWGHLCDKGANPTFLCAIGYVMVCFSLLFLGPVPFIPIATTLWLVIVSLIVGGLGMSARLVAAFAGSLHNTKARGFPDNIATYSMVSALFSSACSAGAFIGPTIGGFFLDTIGYENGTIVILGIELFFLLMMVIHVLIQWYKNRMRNPERAPLLESSVGFEKKPVSIE